MPVVNRPPFWVPRGDQQDTVWFPQPRKSPIIAFLTQQKIFGAGGQVPTRRYAQLLTDNDPPMWQGSPLNSGAIMATKTQLKMFGQPGQGPTKFWLPYLTYDDPPMWQGSPLNSGAIMATKTQVKFFGQPGQAPPFRPNFTYDDATPWSGSPLNSGAITVTRTQVKFYGQPGQAPPFRWNATYDDAAFWLGKPLRSAPIQVLTSQQFYGQGGQVPPFRWNFTYDDASFWAGAPVGSAAIPLLTQQKIFGVGGQVPPFRPNFTYDDASYWAGKPVSSAAIPLLTAVKIFGAGGQVPPFRPNFTYDDPAFWQGSPSASWIIPQLTQQKVYGQGGQAPPYRWNYTLDDPPPWQPWIQINSNLSSRAPFSNRQWQWSDDASGWQGSPLPSGAITVTQTQIKIYGQPGQAPPFRWNATYDDPSSWQPWIQRNLNVLSAVQNPFSNRQWQWSDDAPGWQGTPLNSALISPLTAFILYVPAPAPWMDEDDAAPWRPTTQRNLNLFQFNYTPFSNYKTYWYSEDSFWQGSPLSSGALTVTRTQVKVFGQPGQAPPFRANFTIDDPPMWQGSPVLSQAIRLTTTQVKFYGQPGQAPPFRPQWYDDPAFWQGSPLPSFSTFLSSFTLYKAGAPFPTPPDDHSVWLAAPIGRNLQLLQTSSPFPPFRANFTIDDPPMWQGSPVLSQAIRLTTTQVKFFGQPGQVPAKFWGAWYTVDNFPMWQGTPFSLNYMLTQPGPPVQVSFNDWIDYYRRARRR